LLVTVGAAFIPGATGAPAAATILAEAAARGDLRSRLLILAPPLLALLFAWRASGRLARPFPSYLPLAMLATLSALAVYIAFQLGLYLALRTPFAALPTGQSPWRATLPGATLGWGVMMIVASVRFLWARAAADLRAARKALGAGRPRNS
jgi:hypothetical protein